jgi:hypothetical protein
MDLDYTRALTPARRLAPRRQPYINMLNLAERARINHYHMNHGSFLLHQKILNSDPCIYRQPQVS